MFSAPGDVVSAGDSPKRDKKPFFFGFGSSFSPTSSNPSSSVGLGFSNVWPLTEVLGIERAARESREDLEVKLSVCWIGDLPEMS